jgi:hypothetical protein
MFKPNVLGHVGMILAVLSIGSPAVLQAQSRELPPGAMQHKVTTACTECHDASIIVQQRLSATAWGKEVDKMIKWGAVVDPGDREALVEYLSVNFPTNKPPATMPRASAAKKR